MLRRSRVPLNSVRFDEAPEQAPGILVEEPTLVHTQPKTREQEHPVGGPAQAKVAPPPRLRALLQLDHLLRPSPLQRRIISEPISLYHQQPIGGKLYLSKSDQRSKPVSRTTLVNVTGLKTHYPAQVSGSASSPSDENIHGKSSDSARSSISYARSPAPSPPSRSSSFTSYQESSKNHTRIHHQGARRHAEETSSSHKPPARRVDPKRTRIVSANKSYLPTSPGALQPDNKSTSSTKEVRLRSYLHDMAQKRVMDNPIKPDTVSSPARPGLPVVAKDSYDSIPRALQQVDPDPDFNLAARPTDAPSPPRGESAREASVPAIPTRNFRAQSEPVPPTRPLSAHELTRSLFPPSANHACSLKVVQSPSMGPSSSTPPSTTPFDRRAEGPDPSQLANPTHASSPPTGEGAKDPPQAGSLRPIRTQGLSPIVKLFKHGILQLEAQTFGACTNQPPAPSAALEVRFWLREDLARYLGAGGGDVMVIEQDGTTIQWMKRSANVFSMTPPDAATLEASLTSSIQLATFYKFQALPVPLLYLLKYVERCLDVLRSHAPAVIFQIQSPKFFQRGRCTVMCNNGREPDLVVEWKSCGQKIRVSRASCRVKVWNRKITDNDGSRGATSVELGRCDAQGVLDLELVERLVSGLGGSEGHNGVCRENQMTSDVQRLEDRLICLRMCLVLSGEFLKVLEGGWPD